MKIILILFTLSLFASTCPVCAEKGYGDWFDGFPGFPDMRERRILVLTNTCRMAPVEYRDTYIGDYDILLPQNYPATKPLYWHLDLNRVARAHSRDMANNHGLDHSSSDGTSWDDRIKSYYFKSGRIAENIASGSGDAFGSMRQWIMDGSPDPAPDNNGDGHRKSIMSSSYKEIGVGYAYGEKQWYHFWTQDFSGGSSEYGTPITSGAHFLRDDNTTQFMATYADQTGYAPQKTEVIIDKEIFNLNLLMGAEEQGTYTVSCPTADDCRYYFFRFTNSDGNVWRYPQAGRLVTLGEGSCEEQYENPDSTNGIIYDPLYIKNDVSGFWVSFTNNNQLVLEIEKGAAVPKKVVVANCKGQVVVKQDWVNAKSRCSVKMLSGEGVYFVKVLLNNRTTVVKKVFVMNRGSGFRTR